MLNIIVNQYAGNGLASNNIKKVAKYLKKEKIPYLVYFCEKENDIEEHATSLYKSGEREFILIGGDGSIHKFINAIPDLTKIKLGIIPSGRFNNFANSIHLDSNPIQNLVNILKGKTEKFDYLKCGKILICNCLALGYVESVKHMAMRDNKTHPPRWYDYVKHIKKYNNLQLNFSGEEVKEKNVNILECYICNGAGAGGLNVSPLSNSQDGLANIICVTKKSDKNYISEYYKIKKGKHIYDELNKTFWAKNFSFTSSEMPAKVVIDGELYELDNLTITTVENGLNIYVE